MDYVLSLLIVILTTWCFVLYYLSRELKDFRYFTFNFYQKYKDTKLVHKICLVKLWNKKNQKLKLFSLQNSAFPTCDININFHNALTNSISSLFFLSSSSNSLTYFLRLKLNSLARSSHLFLGLLRSLNRISSSLSTTLSLTCLQ